MPAIQKTLIANSPRRRPRTHMSMDPSCRKRCSSNSPDGRTTDLWLVLVMPVAVLKTHPLEASRSSVSRFTFSRFQFRSKFDLCSRTIDREFIDTMSLRTTCMSFIHISSISICCSLPCLISLHPHEVLWHLGIGTALLASYVG